MKDARSDGEFWSKNFHTLSGKLNLIDPWSSYNGVESEFIFTCSDSKLYREVSLNLNKSGTQERTYWMKDKPSYIFDKM
jgi:hypothetical protein